MYKISLAAVSVILFASYAMADDIISVTGKVSDAFSDKLHYYVNDNLMEIEKISIR
jgi:hypothetical protein